MRRNCECSGKPARIFNILNSPSAERVAEVNTAPAQRSQSLSVSASAASTGLVESVMSGEASLGL